MQIIFIKAAKIASTCYEPGHLLVDADDGVARWLIQQGVARAAFATEVTGANQAQAAEPAPPAPSSPPSKSIKKGR